jgi:hypothetical protein
VSDELMDSTMQNRKANFHAPRVILVILSFLQFAKGRQQMRTLRFEGCRVNHEPGKRERELAKVSVVGKIECSRR